MKNKRLTYALGVAVLVVWGLIIYRFVAYVKTDDISDDTPAAFTKEPYNDYAVKRDTSTLNLKYSDPFGLVKTVDTNKIIKKRVELRSAIAPQPVFNWDFIKYTGYIRNPETKKLIAILQINGKSAMLAEGEVSDNVKLLKNMQDSVKVRFNGKVKYIVIHHG
ncbi:hypothetical protein SAMN05216490_4778 [Mucilaginibacter mallensis]|uniref:Uncharacterized protein n=1 Tax=Mucilaginibacter mallensis TaxID=652787 RepID=A0A1H2CA02_MUCMA|nr:hypothetical protein [Mucilaginibacter mallensis]SDT67283.1 hypothetical protein SAMN05216490_4778 [Mucilaginibacter mallensis]